MGFLNTVYGIDLKLEKELNNNGVISNKYDYYLEYYNHYIEMFEFFKNGGFKQPRAKAIKDTSFHSRMSVRHVRNIVKLIEFHLNESDFYQTHL